MERTLREVEDALKNMALNSDQVHGERSGSERKGETSATCAPLGIQKPLLDPPVRRRRGRPSDKHASNEIYYETQMYQARSVTGHSLHPYNVNPTYGFQPPFLNQGYFMPTDQQSLHGMRNHIPYYFSNGMHQLEPRQLHGSSTTDLNNLFQVITYA
ncbi:hypothetical protein IFM89_030255 [Coptis chinensis]|uniref:Uncharacterized protein n=1 Tax=Coptis chinensis TaxID=261450 RepID=A0A835HZG2_9MAGN|nr:hypothetical protein IFM89_030255 [Coptis chinensis]